MKLRLPNTFVLLFALLALIAAATWLVPGGQYDTLTVAGKQVIAPDSFRQVPSHPQGPVALLTAPIKGFVEAALIIGFVLLVGGAFNVLHKTEAIDALIKSVAKAHSRSRWVRAGLIPLFVTLFSIGGATFGMAEEAIPFVLIFIPLALALRYDSVIGVAIPFVGSQIGFATAFLNPFNVGIAQQIAGVPMFSGLGFRLLCWAVFTALTIAFLMVYAARIKADPTRSYTFEIDEAKRKALDLSAFERFAGMTATHKWVLGLFAATLAGMIVGVVQVRVVHPRDRGPVPGHGRCRGPYGAAAGRRLGGRLRGRRQGHGQHRAGHRAGQGHRGAAARRADHRHPAAQPGALCAEQLGDVLGAEDVRDPVGDQLLHPQRHRAGRADHADHGAAGRLWSA
jgi:uncharacterized ion transporter superfamily protein YfcC